MSRSRTPWEHSVERMGQLYSCTDLATYLDKGYGPGIPIGRDNMLAMFIALLKIAPEPVWDDIERLHEEARRWHAGVPSVAPVAPVDPPAPTVPTDPVAAPVGPIKAVVAGGDEVEIGTLFEL